MLSASTTCVFDGAVLVLVLATSVFVLLLVLAFFVFVVFGHKDHMEK